MKFLTIVPILLSECLWASAALSVETFDEQLSNCLSKL